MGRVDKKRKVAPYISQQIRTHVHDVSRYLGKPEGETGVRLVLVALNDYPTLNKLAPYLWRDYAHGTKAWIGHRHHENLDSLINSRGQILERLSLRFTLDDWAALDALGFALGRPVSHAVATLLRFSRDSLRLTQMVAPGYQPRTLYQLREVSQ